MRVTVRTNSDAEKLRELIPKGSKRDARIVAAEEMLSKKGNPTIELNVLVRNAPGDDRMFRVWLTDAGLGAALLRHACEAIDAISQYEAGSIEAEDFVGKPVRVTIGVEKKQGWPARNIISDFAKMTEASVAPLRRAAP